MIDAEPVLPFSRGAKYMDNHPSAVSANARGKKKESRKNVEKERATGVPNAAKLITGRVYRIVYIYRKKERYIPTHIHTCTHTEIKQDRAKSIQRR